MNSQLLFGVFLGTLIMALTSCGSTPTPTSTVPTTVQGPITVQVTLSDYKIESSLTTFSKGVPYHFVITNKGKVDHEFMIVPMMMGNMSMEDMHKAALARIDHVAVGATTALDYTFTQTASQGQLEFACHLPGHYEKGMHLAITVN